MQPERYGLANDPNYVDAQALNLASVLAHLRNSLMGYELILRDAGLSLSGPSGARTYAENVERLAGHLEEVLRLVKSYDPPVAFPAEKPPG
jgi:hypothetical protein